MADILIVDDERAVREGLKGILQGEGFGVRTARDGEDALRKIAERRPDLVLLDVMMPKMNGFRCCEKIRETDALLPVVFLTAKDAEADQVRALGLGADAYLPKETGDPLLLASIRRAIGRVNEFAGGAGTKSGSLLRLADVTVDFRSLEIRNEAGEVMPITKTEAGLLMALSAHRGVVLTADELIAAVRGEGFACEDSMLYSHIGRLRNKLGPKAAALIENKRGVGYSLIR